MRRLGHGVGTALGTAVFPMFGWRRSDSSRCETVKMQGHEWPAPSHHRFSMESAARCVSKSLPRKPQAPVRHDCGDDAFFFTSLKERITIGVADGVSSWQRYGVNPALFAWELMVRCEEVASSSGKLEVVDLMTAGFEKAIGSQDGSLMGSTTACLASLHCDKGLLDVANLGDSGALVIQPDGKVILETKEQQHYFNCPYQLVCLPVTQRTGLAGGDLPASSDKYTTQVRIGDILVFATDGFFDNVWKEKAVEVIVEMGAQQAPVTEIASRLVQMAYSSSRNPGEESPFAQAAAAHGFRHRGGKPDDITVLVARVISGTVSHS